MHRLVPLSLLANYFSPVLIHPRPYRCMLS
jgi:hypothetical protein